MEFPKFSPRAVDLIRSGVITVDVHLARDGASVVGRCVQPHPRLKLRACDSFNDIEELVRLLGDVKTDFPHQTPPTLRTGRSGESPLVDVGTPPTFVYKHGVKNELPKASLCFADFGLSEAEFQARARSVCNRLGSAKIVSRITTQTLVLEIKGAKDLTEWWERATSLQRWIVLTTAKMVGHPPPGCSYQNLRGQHHAMLSNLSCPFLDAGIEIRSKSPVSEDDPEGYAHSEQDSEIGALVE